MVDRKMARTEVKIILNNHSLILYSPAFNQTQTDTVLVHQRPTIVLENSPSTYRPRTFRKLWRCYRRRNPNIESPYPTPGDDPCPGEWSGNNEALMQINAAAGNQPPFTFLRQQADFDIDGRLYAVVQTYPSINTRTINRMFTLRRGPFKRYRRPFTRHELRTSIRFVYVIYDAGRFTFILRAYIRLDAGFEVPPRSSRGAFMVHLMGEDIDRLYIEESSGTSEDGSVADIEESSGTSEDGSVENRSADIEESSEDGSVESISADLFEEDGIMNEYWDLLMSDPSDDDSVEHSWAAGTSAGAPPNRIRQRTVHDVVSGREIRPMKRKLIVVVISSADQRALVVVSHWEQVSMLRQRLVEIQFNLPRPIYVFLHHHRIMDDHLSFEQNHVDHGDYIQPFPAFILAP